MSGRSPPTPPGLYAGGVRKTGFFRIFRVPEDPCGVGPGTGGGAGPVHPEASVPPDRPAGRARTPELSEAGPVLGERAPAGERLVQRSRDRPSARQRGLLTTPEAVPAERGLLETPEARPTPSPDTGHPVVPRSGGPDTLAARPGSWCTPCRTSDARRRKAAALARSARTGRPAGASAARRPLARDSHGGRRAPREGD